MALIVIPDHLSQALAQDLKSSLGTKVFYIQNKQINNNLIYSASRDSQDQPCNYKTKLYSFATNVAFSAGRARYNSFSASLDINHQLTSSKQNILPLGKGEEKSKPQVVALFLTR